jgi:GT2 family glycosyltransferase
MHEALEHDATLELMDTRGETAEFNNRHGAPFVVFSRRWKYHACAMPTPPAPPAVGFVILNWNQPVMTADCLRSVLAQDYANAQIIVVDNGSTDESVQKLHAEFPTVTLMPSPVNLGYSEGNNFGIREAERQGAAYVFLLNNDTIVAPAMLSQLMAVAESDPGIGIVGPTMYYAEPPDVLWGGENRIDWRHARMIRKYKGQVLPDAAQRPPCEVDYVDTCAVLIKKAVLARTGLMDARFFINFDDLDLNLRARQAGYKIVYVPEAQMWHKVSATMGQASAATTYYMTRNALLFFWLHAPGIWKWLAPAQVLLRTVSTIGAWSLKAKYRNQAFRRKRDANLYALRDFVLRRFGRMGPDVAQACHG